MALHQFVYWLIAGVFNVRADRAITWPAEQAIGELRLDFIRLAKGTDRLRIALISLAPLIAGLAAIWLISNHVLNVQSILDVVATGQWDNLPAALAKLTATPDFYIWVYIVFTISNTMMPSFTDLKPLRIVVIVLIGGVAASLIFHIADEAILRALSGPIRNGLQVLAGTFAVMMAFDLLAVAVLGTIEALIERVTGDSATFQNGKMITMSREELQRLREQEQAKKDRERSRRASTPSGPPSIYKVQFPIPDLPGREAATAAPITVRRDDSAGLPAPSLPTAAASTPSASPSPAFGSSPNPTSSPLRPGVPTPTGANPPASPLRPGAPTPAGETPAASPLRPSMPSPTGGNPTSPRPSVPSPFGGGSSSTPAQPQRPPSTGAPNPSIPRPAAASTSGTPTPGSPLSRPGGPTPSGLTSPRPPGSPPTGGASTVRPFGGPPKPALPHDNEDDDEAIADAAPAQPRGTLRPGWLSKPPTAPAPAPKPVVSTPGEETDEEADDDAVFIPAQPRGTARPAQALSGRSLTDFMGAGIYDKADKAEEHEDEDGGDEDGLSYEPAEDSP